jgi:hypothetical protein
VSGVAAAIQTFGDFWVFNPHSHVLLTDDCVGEEGLFRRAT